MLDYNDTHINDYSCYVTRNATPTSAQPTPTLSFRDWFQQHHSHYPGRYVGLVFRESILHETGQAQSTRSLGTASLV